MTYDLKDKVVIVTGASLGIGKSCVERLIQLGSKVVLVSRNESKLNELAGQWPEADTLVVPADVSDEAQVKRMVDQVIDHYQRVDVLINNAGVGLKGSILTAPIEIYESMMKTNVFGVLYCIRSVYPHMKKQKSGVIVNVSSVAGIKGFPDCGLYSSSKFAVNGMTESFEQNAKHDNINVILFCPGKVESEFENNVVYRDEPYDPKRTGISSPEAAESLINAIQKNKKMVVVGKKCIPLYWLNRLSPRLTNYIISKIY